TVELVCHPDERAEDGGAVIAGQVHDAGLDDETAEFDQVPRTFPAFDLPCLHIMPRPLRLLPIARCPVAPEHHHRRGQTLMQIAAICPERTPLRVSPMAPSLRHRRFRPARSARPPV